MIPGQDGLLVSPADYLRSLRHPRPYFRCCQMGWVKVGTNPNIQYCQKRSCLANIPHFTQQTCCLGNFRRFFQFSLVDIFLLYVPHGNFVVCWKQKHQKKQWKNKHRIHVCTWYIFVFLKTIHMYQIYVSIAWVVCVSQECFTELGVFFWLRIIYLWNRWCRIELWVLIVFHLLWRHLYTLGVQVEHELKGFPKNHYVSSDLYSTIPVDRFF